MTEGPPLERQLEHSLTAYAELVKVSLAKTTILEAQDKELAALRERNVYLEGLRKLAWDVVSKQ